MRPTAEELRVELTQIANTYAATHPRASGGGKSPLPGKKEGLGAASSDTSLMLSGRSDASVAEVNRVSSAALGAAAPPPDGTASAREAAAPTEDGGPVVGGARLRSFTADDQRLEKSLRRSSSNRSASLTESSGKEAAPGGEMAAMAGAPTGNLDSGRRGERKDTTGGEERRRA